MVGCSGGSSSGKMTVLGVTSIGSSVVGLVSQHGLSRLGSRGNRRLSSWYRRLHILSSSSYDKNKSATSTGKYQNYKKINEDLDKQEK
jgi:hypothetical protein